MTRKLFFAPGFFVDIGKCNFAVAGVDAVDSGLAFSIKITLRSRTVWKLYLVLLTGDRFSNLIE